MKRRYREFRDIGRATFPRHQRGVDILGVLSIVVLVGVSATGAWQFFAHELNPEWFGYMPGGTFSVNSKGPTGMALAHRFFGDAAAILALMGGAWFCFQIVYRVPAVVVVIFCCTLFAVLTEALVRFNLIKLQGLTFEEVGPGYPQVFGSDVDYVVTDAGQTNVGVFRLLILSHIATVPILVGFGWVSIVRGIDRRTKEMAAAPKRTWMTGSENS